MAFGRYGTLEPDFELVPLYSQGIIPVKDRVPTFETRFTQVLWLPQDWARQLPVPWPGRSRLPQIQSILST